MFSNKLVLELDQHFQASVSIRLVKNYRIHVVILDAMMSLLPAYER